MISTPINYYGKYDVPVTQDHNGHILAQFYPLKLLKRMERTNCLFHNSLRLVIKKKKKTKKRAYPNILRNLSLCKVYIFYHNERQSFLGITCRFQPHREEYIINEIP